MSATNDSGEQNTGGSYAQGDFSASSQRSAAHSTPDSDLPGVHTPVQAESAVFSTDHRQIPAVERIARVLAGRRLSINGLGTSPSAGAQVDQIWESFLDDALGILNALREPDPAMLAAGDRATWTAMVRAALGEPYERSSPRGTEAPGEIYQKPLG